MSKRKATPRNKTVLIFALLALVIVSILWNIWLHRKTEPQIAPFLTQQTKKTLYYPTQYSDTHITANAVIADARFRNTTFVNRENLLANVPSAVEISSNESTSTELENGTWLWTPILDITLTYADTIISGAKRNGIRNIYISIDSYLDIYVMPEGKEKDDRQKSFDATLESFIAEAHKNNMTVDAEGGWRNWAEIGHSYKAFAVLDYAISFNKTHTEKLRGFQYDVEPYVLWYYQNDKKIVLTNFLNLINQSVSYLDKSDLKFSVVIPDFYDGKSGETPKFSFGGSYAYTLEHLLNILDQRAGSKIIVMSYRNFTTGNDGSINISKDEISQANKYQTKIIVAQETGNVAPSYVTFYNTTKSYYNKQIKTIEQTFSHDRSYGGIATHYINSLLELE